MRARKQFWVALLVALAFGAGFWTGRNLARKDAERQPRWGDGREVAAEPWLESI